jgi:hypothetical protein
MNRDAHTIRGNTKEIQICVPVVDGGGTLIFRWWCWWARLAVGGRGWTLGEGKMEEMDGKGWKKLTAVGFFFNGCFIFFKELAISHPLDLFKKIWAMNWLFSISHEMERIRIPLKWERKKKRMKKKRAQEEGGEWRQRSSHFPCLNSRRGGKPSLRNLENLHIGSERAPWCARGRGVFREQNSSLLPCLRSRDSWEKKFRRA